MSSLGDQARVAHAAVMADMRDLIRRLEKITAELDAESQHDEPAGLGEGRRMPISPTASLADIAADIADRHRDLRVRTWLGLASEAYDAEPAHEALISGYIESVTDVLFSAGGLCLVLSPVGMEDGLGTPEYLDALAAIIRRVRGWNRCEVVLYAVAA